LFGDACGVGSSEAEAEADRAMRSGRGTAPPRRPPTRRRVACEGKTLCAGVSTATAAEAPSPTHSASPSGAVRRSVLLRGPAYRPPQRRPIRGLSRCCCRRGAGSRTRPLSLRERRRLRESAGRWSSGRFRFGGGRSRTSALRWTEIGVGARSGSSEWEFGVGRLRFAGRRSRTSALRWTAESDVCAPLDGSHFSDAFASRDLREAPSPS